MLGEINLFWGLLFAGIYMASSVGEIAVKQISNYVREDPLLIQKARELNNRIVAMPEFEKWFKKKGIKPTQQNAALAIISLSRQGVERLDDEMLAEWITLMNRMLLRLDYSTCASLAVGEVNPIQQIAALETLFPNELSVMMEISFRAVAADLKGYPIIKIKEENLKQAGNTFLKSLSKKEIVRLRSAFTSTSQLPKHEICWAARTIYSKISSLETHARQILTRALSYQYSGLL